METIPRFEYRIFGLDLNGISDRVREVARYEDKATNRDTYLVCSIDESKKLNVKVRQGTIGIKERLEVRGPLERWKPVSEYAFPVRYDFLRELFIEVRSMDDTFSEGECDSLESLVYDIIQPAPHLAVAWVEKERYQFNTDDCPIEIDKVRINGVSIESVAVEGEDPDAVSETADRLGFGDRENMDYSKLVRRTIGMEFYPGQPWYRDQ